MVDKIFLYDFSNNTYYIDAEKVVYSPMTPERSSSGTYSGGDPANVSITKDQFDKLLIIVLNLAIQIHTHRDKRAMMTAKLSLKSGDYSYGYILGNSEDLDNLLQELKNIIKT